jgi:membrane protease YdiL (CAAX protease family)
MTTIAPDQTTDRSAAAPAAGSGIKQYTMRQLAAIWAAAALPMALLAWVIAPWLADRLGAPSSLPKALLLCMTAGLVWQFVLVVVLLVREQRSLRWSRVRPALWLQSPRSPRSGRRGGRVWLVLPLLLLGFAAEELVPAVGHAADRDLAVFFDSVPGHELLSGSWGWFGVIAALAVFNTVLGEELLFRGLLLPRMSGAFGRGGWVANGVLFAAYHLHMPWVLPSALFDMFALSYPSKRYRSALIGIAVHSAQSVVIVALVFSLVPR